VKNGFFPEKISASSGCDVTFAPPMEINFFLARRQQSSPGGKEGKQQPPGPGARTTHALVSPIAWSHLSSCRGGAYTERTHRRAGETRRACVRDPAANERGGVHAPKKQQQISSTTTTKTTSTAYTSGILVSSFSPRSPVSLPDSIPVTRPLEPDRVGGFGFGGRKVGRR
jgi:hypothetical protein